MLAAAPPLLSPDGALGGEVGVVDVAAGAAGDAVVGVDTGAGAVVVVDVDTGATAVVEVTVVEVTVVDVAAGEAGEATGGAVPEELDPPDWLIAPPIPAPRTTRITTASTPMTGRPRIYSLG